MDKYEEILVGPVASDMDAIKARLRRLCELPAQDVPCQDDIRALLAENERLTEALRAATHDEWPEFLEAKAVEVARLTAEVERWKKSSETFEWGARLQEENYHDALKGWRAEVETLQAALAELTERKRVVDEQLAWALSRIDEIGDALAAANERAEKLSSDIQSLLARADAMGAQAANSPGVSDDRYWRSRGFEDLRMGLRAALRPTAPEPEEKP